MFTSEIKNGICNLKFLAGAVIILGAACSSLGPYLKQLLNVGSGEGPGWYAAFMFMFFSEKTLLFVPIVATFAASSNAEAELHSRFMLYSCSRVSKKGYTLGKIAGTFIPGGIMVLLGAFMSLLLCVFKTSNVLQAGTPISNINIVLKLIIVLTVCFLNGGFWALAGSCAAIITKNKYMAYAVPFILYYVLTIFQERYYPKLLFFSPRVWASPNHYSMYICILALLSMSIIAGALFYQVLNWRIRHV